MADPILVFERCLYIGNAIGCILYGLELYIAFHCVYLLFHQPSRSGVSKLFYISYVTAIILTQTVSIATQVLNGQMMWIEHRDFPGGPVAYFDASAADWYNVMGTIFVEVTNFLGDSLLLYRCYIVWGSSWGIIVLPSMVFLASTVMAIIALIQSAMPGGSIFAQESVNFLIPWISLTSSLNVLLTALIAYRLLSARRHLLATNITEAKELSAVYTGVVAILVESALPFSVLGILFAVLLGVQNTAYTMVSVLWGNYTGLAPLLVIHRVAIGKAWSSKTAGQLISTELRFATGITDSTLRDRDLENGSSMYFQASSSTLKRSKPE